MIEMISDNDNLDRSILDLVIPIVKEGKTFDEAFREIVIDGYPTFDTEAENRAFRRDLDAAVEIDPFWEFEGRGWRPLPGAIHRTPAALVAAYRKSQG